MHSVNCYDMNLAECGNKNDFGDISSDVGDIDFDALCAYIREVIYGI